MPQEGPSLRLLALADFTGTGGAKSTRVAIDKERFDAVLASVSPRLLLAVPNRLGAGPDPLHIELAFQRLADFGPAAIIERVPALARLRDAGPTPPPPAPSKPAPASAPPAAVPAPSKAGGGVDSILDLVDGEGSADPRDTARRLVDGLVPSRAATGRPAGGAAPSAALDRALTAQLDAIFDAPAFRALESAWRGLKLLVDRTDFREAIVLEIVSASVDEAPAAIDALFDGDDVDAVLADYALDASARDFARAEEIAAAAARAQTPVAIALAPAFFGLDSWRALARARNPVALFDEPAYASWRSLRDREESRWLVLMANRIALRAAYGSGGESTRGLPYEQARDGGLLGSPVWALGSALVRAFARTGACLQFTGAQHGLVADLPLLPTGPDDKPAPVEGVFSNERREDLEKSGLSAVQLYQRDIAFLGAVRSFRRPTRYPDAEATADAAQQITLAYQMYASRLVKFLGRLLPELSGLDGPEAVKRELRSSVLRFVSTGGKPLAADHVGIEVRPNPDDGALYDVSLRVLPEVTIAGRPANLLMSFAMRR